MSAFRNTQPVAQVGLALSNPLTRGCVLAVIPSVGNINLVNQRRLTVSATLNPSARYTKFGRAIKEGTSGAPYWETVIDIGNIYTVMSFGMYTADTVNDVVLAYDASANLALIHRSYTSATNQFLPFNTSGGLGSAASGGVQDATEVLTGSAFGGYTTAAGGTACWTGRGVTATGSNPTIRNLHTVRMLFVTTAGRFTHSVAIWNRTLTLREMQSFNCNPWQLFAPAPRRIYLPAAAGGTTNEVSASDGLYLLDLRRKEELHQRTDGFLIVDARTSQVSLLGHDKMFLFDQALAQAVRQRYVLDPIYLLDSYSSAQQHVTGDGLYLLDTRVGVQEHTFREGVLLNDYSIKSLLKVLADGLLLFDQVTSSAAQQFSVTVIDGLYLQDYYLRAVLKIIRDAMLLFDQVTAQTTTGQNLYTVTATDFMLLGDSDTRQLLKQVIEFMLLGDSVQRELLRTRIASDQVLLTDLVQRAIGKYGLDSLMLDDASRRLREMLLREGLYLSDSAATALFVIGAEFLTFARLRMVHLLGIRVSAVHLLGIRIGVAGWKVMQ